MRALAVLATILTATCGAVSLSNAAESSSNTIVLGTTNESLSAGSRALEQGRAEDGIQLTLEGIKSATEPRDIAAGHANLCAGYAMLKKWELALLECNLSIEMDRSNWRAFNNRSAVFTATGFYDQAIADALTGLKLAPGSPTLKKTLGIVYEHKKAHRDRSRRAPTA
jgi:tetratricopeptide (TPR) repeat protein